MPAFEDPDVTFPTIPERARLTRLVHDYRAGQSLRGTGIAVWTPEGEGGAFAMTESLLFNGFDASRETVWRWFGAPRDLVIDHLDGTPLVRFSWPFDRAEAVHHCGPDLYRARLRWGRCIVIGWRVTGPKKNYAMVTVYRPHPALVI